MSNCDRVGANKYLAKATSTSTIKRSVILKSKDRSYTVGWYAPHVWKRALAAGEKAYDSAHRAQIDSLKQMNAMYLQTMTAQTTALADGKKKIAVLEAAATTDKATIAADKVTIAADKATIAQTQGAFARRLRQFQQRADAAAEADKATIASKTAALATAITGAKRLRSEVGGLLTALGVVDASASGPPQKKR